MDSKLLEMLVCPVTRGPLILDRERQAEEGGHRFACCSLRVGSLGFEAREVRGHCDEGAEPSVARDAIQVVVGQVDR